MSDPTGSDCGCYEGIADETPVVIGNRPGLPAIAYRVGTWAQFKASMLDALSTFPELAALSTRSDDDFTIALLDAWAVACDILTFYQERIANEAYLGTATELVSVGELAKLIGYKLRPGLAASVPLSFTVSSPPPIPPSPSGTAAPNGGPPSIPVSTGTKAQSTPDPGQQAATFETVAPVTVRAEWTSIAPRLTAVGEPSTSADITLATASSSLRAGDTVLLTATVRHTARRQLQRITNVALNAGAGTTLVQFGAGAPTPAALPAGTASAPKTALLNDAFVRDSVRSVAWPDQTDLVAFALTQGWPIDDLEDAINAFPAPAPPVQAHTMGVDAALFGHNAVDWNTIPSNLQQTGVVFIEERVSRAGHAVFTGYPDWNGYSLADVSPGPNQVDLDQAYAAIVPGAWISLADTGAATFFTTVTSVQEVTRNDFLISGKVSRVTLAGWPSGATSFGMRTTQVRVSTGTLPVTGIPLSGVLGTGALTLDRAYLSLVPGQLVAVTGLRADKASATATEVAAIGSVGLAGGYTTVTFNPPLTATYLLASVTLNANVAPATHGETRSEILGSGDATQTFQSFALKQPPLTYISAATPTGAQSTLSVQVDGVIWTEVPWLAGSGPADRVYTVSIGPDANTYVTFGDGVTGARPGTGTNNILATYRSGIGAAGLVRAGQISMLLTRPLGLKGVLNMLPSTGAADPETVAQARPNAPLSVLTIGRVVSLADAGNFAAASAGVGKASADWIWGGTRFVACVTVAGVEGAPVVPGSAQYNALLAALNGAGDPTLPLILCNYVPQTFTVSASVTGDPSLVPADVLTAVKAALVAAFCFDQRAFSQPVYRSEVVTVIQQVPGVVAVTLSVFDVSGNGGLQDVLVAPAPTLGASGLIGASLLTLETGMLPGVVMAAS